MSLDVIDWEWEPWMMDDGLQIAAESDDTATIARIGITALSRSSNTEIDDSHRDWYEAIWQEAAYLLDNRGDVL